MYLARMPDVKDQMLRRRPARAWRCAPHVASLVLALLVLGPALALASTPEAASRGNYRGQCRRLTKQLAHYQGTILPMAEARGNEPWKAATEAQIDRLYNRRADLCPEYAAQRSLLKRAAEEIRQFNALLVAAGKAAASYFSGGAVGP